jgi:hypothetical protein
VLVERYGPVVQEGPFAGLRLSTERAWGSAAPLIVGSYEEELHDVVEALIAQAPGRFIDVGCADGYYAVGFATRLPSAQVYAFDISESARRRTLATARINNVAERVHLGGECTTDGLRVLLGPDTVLMVDCEGCEVQLLRPEAAPELAQVTMIIELHTFADPLVLSKLTASFSGTHRIQRIRCQPRGGRSYAATADLTPADRALALDEGRGPAPLGWALLSPSAAPR